MKMENALDSELLETTKIKKPFLSLWVMLIYIFPILIGFMFKIQHWPGASFLILVFTGLLSGYCLARIVKYPKHKVAKIVLGGALLSLFVIVFLTWNYFNINALVTLGIAFLLTFIVTFVRANKELR